MIDEMMAIRTARDAFAPALVPDLARRWTALWWQCDTSTPPLGPTFTPGEQLANEAQLEQLLAAVTAELKRPLRTPSERAHTQERVLTAFAGLARSALGFQERHLDVLLRRGFTQVASEFAQMARRFDPAVGGDDIFQASRNVWTMNGLQLLLGLPVRLTPAIFAYSMLYPYTDNYLDDPAIPVATKVAFSERFRQRLTGEHVAPANEHERRIYNLVAMIEDQFERPHYPQVYGSLLAIHRAQEKSLRLLHGNTSPYEVDVLGIGLEKGGTSVLADGYLVAGTLTEAQADFMFGWGAFVQFGDDLQDVEEDGQDGLMTIFSQTARHGSLESLTNRTLHFGLKVLEGLACFDTPGAEPVKELIQRSAVQLITGAAGRAPQHYRQGYLCELEAHSPFRYSFLARQGEKLARQRVSLMRLIEAFASPERAA